MRGVSEVVGVLLLVLFAISLAVIVQGVVMTTVNRQYKVTDFSPLPDLLSASGIYIDEGSTYRVELNLAFTSCSGVKDSQATLVGHDDKLGDHILGAGLVEDCKNGRAKSSFEVNDLSSYSMFYVYVWKLGLKTKEVPVSLTEYKPPAGSTKGPG